MLEKERESEKGGQAVVGEDQRGKGQTGRE